MSNADIINANNALLEAAFENTLSRDGTPPNGMLAPIDMGSNRITSLPAPSSPTEPVRKQEFDALVAGGGLGTVVGPVSSIAGHAVSWNSTNGTIIADSGKVFPSGALVGDTDAQTLTNKTMTNPVVGTQAAGNNSTFAASTAFVGAAILAAKYRPFIDIRDYGGVGDDTTFNDTAFTNAWNALSASGVGCIYIPAGVYRFNSQIVKTITAITGSVTIMGDGPRATELHFPNGTGGLKINQGSFRGNIHLHSFSVTTGQANAGVGIDLQSAFSFIPTTGWSSVSNIQITGDDWRTSFGYANSWATALRIGVWSYINFYNVNTYGKDTSGAGGVDRGVVFEGTATGSLYCVLLNFVSCTFNYHQYGATYGDWVQGVTFTSCNFNGQSGGNGIFVAGSATGVLAQLGVMNCQFDTGNAALSINSTLFDIECASSSFTVSKNSANALSLGFANGFNIVGCKMSVGGTPTGTTGIVIGGTGFGVITGCSFAGLTLGVNLLSGTADCVVGLNTYKGVGTKVINSASVGANSVGTQATGNMAGVVP